MFDGCYERLQSHFLSKDLQFYVLHCRLLLPQKTQLFCLAPCQPTMEMEGAPSTWPWEESPQLRVGERYAALSLGTTLTYFFNVFEPLNVKCYLCVTQVEIGAGDTHGPLFGLKIFRNLTPRLYAMKLKRTEISTQSQYFFHCNMKN